MEDGTLDGLWTIAGKEGSGTEMLTPGQLAALGASRLRSAASWP